MEQTEEATSPIEGQTAARSRHDTSMMWHDMSQNGTTRHGGAVVSCCIVSPCRGRGPGIVLQAISRVVSCRHTRVVVPPCFVAVAEAPPAARRHRECVVAIIRHRKDML